MEKGLKMKRIWHTARLLLRLILGQDQQPDLPVTHVDLCQHSYLGMSYLLNGVTLKNCAHLFVLSANLTRAKQNPKGLSGTAVL